MIKEAIAQLVKRNDLTAETMGEVMEEIMTNQATGMPRKHPFLRH